MGTGLFNREKYVPGEGLNSTFLEIINRDIITRPSKEGFQHGLYSLAKRLGITTKQNGSGGFEWQGDADFQGGYKSAQTIYLYTSNGTSYSFDGNDLTQEESGLDFDATRKNEGVRISYPGGGRFPNNTTTLTVDSYNSATAELTFFQSVNSSYVNKYVYIQTSSGGAQRQLRRIDLVSGPKTVTLNSSFDVDPQTNDVVYIYNDLEGMTIFPQLRNSSDSDYAYMIADSGETRYFYSPTGYKLVFWDNRVFTLSTTKTAIIPSSVTDYEVADITRIVEFGNDVIRNITVFQGYLFVFFDNKVGVIRKKIIDQSTQDFIYSYEDVLDFGLFSEDSFLVEGSNLYIYANDNVFYSIDLQITDDGRVYANGTDQGKILVNYFSEITTGEVFMKYIDSEIYFIHRTTIPVNKTTVYKYNNVYSARLIHEYSFVNNFMEFFESLGNLKYLIKDDVVAYLGGLTDLGENYEQRLSLYGPVNEMMSMITLLQIKVRIGFDGNPIGGKLRYCIGGYRYECKEVDLTDLDIIDRLNAYAVGGGTMGSNIMGDSLFGGEDGIGVLTQYFNQYFDVGYRIGKKGSYFEFEITNDTEKQLIISGIETQFNVDNPFIVYNKGVL